MFYFLSIGRPLVIVATIVAGGVGGVWVIRHFVGADKPEPPMLSMYCPRCNTFNWCGSHDRFVQCSKCNATIPVRTVGAGDERDIEFETIP
ncbi:MAG: hypothetical protein SH850_20970 [Planctomycetaceae bacterium]|nr:hypothetical protein [Planctomycetaceae bacterium]